MIKLASIHHMSLCLLASTAISVAQPPTPLSKMPTTFRCVMDNHTRVLFIKLNATTAIAYDTGRCKMIKVWQDPDGNLIRLEGPVFNGQHGKQPLSIGKVLLKEENSLFHALEGQKKIRLQYIGHKLRTSEQGIQTTMLLYSVRDTEGKELGSIEEIPTITENNIHRSFKVNLSDGVSLGLRNNNQQWSILKTGEKLTPRTISQSAQFTLTHTL